MKYIYFLFFFPVFVSRQSKGMVVRRGITVYSFFDKGCPTKPYATMPKVIMANGDSWSLIEALDVSAT